VGSDTPGLPPLPEGIEQGGSYILHPDGRLELVARTDGSDPRGPRAEDGTPLDAPKVVEPSLPELPPRAARKKEG